MAISTPEQPKDRRFQLRATASEEALIKVAAERHGLNAHQDSGRDTDAAYLIQIQLSCDCGGGLRIDDAGRRDGLRAAD